MATFKVLNTLSPCFVCLMTCILKIQAFSTSRHFTHFLNIRCILNFTSCKYSEHFLMFQVEAFQSGLASDKRYFQLGFRNKSQAWISNHGHLFSLRRLVICISKACKLYSIHDQILPIQNLRNIRNISSEIWTGLQDLSFSVLRILSIGWSHCCFA